MSNYRYFSGAFTKKAVKTIRKGPRPVMKSSASEAGYLFPALKKATGPAGSGTDGSDWMASASVKADLSKTVSFDTEDNVELKMQIRRGTKKPYFKAKAKTLFNLSEDINGQLASIETGMLPKLNEWLGQLGVAEALLDDLVGELNDLHKGPNAVFNWIISFAGSLGASSIGSARENSRVAVDEANAALDTVRSKINEIRGYKNDLAYRQKLSQLRTWKGGSDLTGMIENVSRHFGIDQRGDASGLVGPRVFG